MSGEVATLRHDNAVVLLEAKLKAWVVQQPEWLTIIELPRQQRRAAMRELAQRLYSIPIMDGANTVPRVVRRKAAKTLAHAAKTGQLTDLVKEALAEAALDEAVESVMLVPEAVASTALDGETQVVEEVLTEVEFLGALDESEATEAVAAEKPKRTRKPKAPVEVQPDPGDGEE